MVISGRMAPSACAPRRVKLATPPTMKNQRPGRAQSAVCRREAILPPVGKEPRLCVLKHSRRCSRDQALLRSISRSHPARPNQLRQEVTSAGITTAGFCSLEFKVPNAHATIDSVMQNSILPAYR